MAGLQRELEREIFDEVAYRDRYPDIAKAIDSKIIVSAWQHYDRYGREEGRLLIEFNSQFYLRAYPLAVQEIAAGLAVDALEHFARFGRGRGYLPHIKAKRPKDAAANRSSSFGGFWIDQPNVLDLIRGRLDTGAISDRQAAHLQQFATNGYVVLTGAVPDELIERARRDLDKAFCGGFPDLLIQCPPLAKKAMAWRPEMDPFPAKAIDLHWFSAATRDLIFADAIVEFLGSLFGSRLFATQTLGFLRGSAQEAHQDSAYVAYTIPRQFAATWIALEDVTLGAGELFYYAGSHRRFPEFIYGGEYKSVPEAERNDATDELEKEKRDHVVALEEQAKLLGLERDVFAAKRGDVLIWHSDLAHGGSPVSREVTRKSVVTHYCPRHISPLFAEHGRTQIYEHKGHLYTSAPYVSRQPSD